MFKVLLLLVISLISPFNWHEDIIPLPNPKPEDCIIVPLEQAHPRTGEIDPIKTA